MGTSVSKNIGDFQQSAGQVTGQLSVLSAYFFAFIATIISIILAYYAFVPTSLQNDNAGTHKICTTDDDCKITNEICSKDKGCVPAPEIAKKHYWFLLVSVIILAIAIYSVYYAITIRDIAQSSRGGAQVVGLMGEGEFTRSLFT